MLGKVIVLVREDQLSLAIGKKGQNVRLASQLIGWQLDLYGSREWLERGAEFPLFAGGEDDAQSLGVHPMRVKLLSLAAAALAAAVAVAAAGQIAFVGLVVPHLLRLLSGASHRSLLPLCLVGGPVFLLGCDVLQRWLLRDAALQPGVLMSLLGGPFFIYLLFRNRAVLRGW